METTSYLKGGFNDPSESPEAYLLRRFKGQIESICNLLDFDANLQRVNSNDIDGWERELRAILKEINRLRDTSYIDSLLDSSDAVRNGIIKALDHFYVASDILQKKGTIREREKFYEKLRASSYYLSKALEYFLV
jgi:ABC-type xylose transport system substrate-binding protein